MSLVFVSLLAEPLHSAYRELCEKLAHGEDLAIRFQECPTWQEGLEMLESGEAQAGAICGLLYARLRAKGIPIDPVAVPVLNSERYEDSGVYWSDLVVRRDSDISAFEHLEGRTWLFNEVGSFSGYRTVLADLRRRGLSRNFFGEQIASGSHQQSLDRLLAGEGDFTALDSTLLDHLEPEQKEQLRLIDSVGPSPMPPIVAHGGQNQFREACRNLKDLPQLFQRLESVDEKTYASIREDWNQSLEVFQRPCRDEYFLVPEEVLEGRGFTSSHLAALDQDILSSIARGLENVLEADPSRILDNGTQFYDWTIDHRPHHTYLLRPNELRGENFSVVGFLGELSHTVDLGRLFAADAELVAQFHEYDGFIAYSSRQLEDGNWANLAVFRDRKSKDRWAENCAHLRSIADIAPESYSHIRLHLADWQSLNGALRFLVTRYLEYSDKGLWRGVRTH